MIIASYVVLCDMIKLGDVVTSQEFGNVLSTYKAASVRLKKISPKLAYQVRTGLNMIVVIKILFLFLLYDGTASQDPTEMCINVEAELAANPECYLAFTSENLTRSTLEVYCSPSCRPIIQRAVECNNSNESSNVISASEVVNLTCSVNGNGHSCVEFIESLQSSVVGCISFVSCIPGCEVILEEAVDLVGCCYYPLIDAFGEVASFGAAILQNCDVDPPPRQPTCEVIGGSNNGSEDNNGDGDNNGGGNNNGGGGATDLKATSIGIILSMAIIVASL